MTKYVLIVLFGLPLTLAGQNLDQQAQTLSNKYWNQLVT